MSNFDETAELETTGNAEKGHEHETLAEKAIFVIVKYPAAAHPFKEIEPRKEILAKLKKKVLHAFGLHEGEQPDGSTIVYYLYHGKKRLDNMSETLKDIAGDAEEIKLKLVQEITQGRSGFSELSVLNFTDDTQEALSCEDATRWKIEVIGSLEIYATISPLNDDKETFQARFFWEKYPGEPPSLKFRDPASGRLDLPTAWPLVRGFRPPSFDTCVNWSKEGFDLHPEWRNDPQFRWDPRGNALLKVLRILQDELDENFQGRFKQ